MTFEAFMGSIPGPYHVQRSIPNQDAILFHEEEGIVILAVADGAGSLKHSDVGAYEAVETAVHSITEALGEGSPLELVTHGLAKAREQLLAKDDYRLYGATLTVAVLLEDGSGAVAAVGDSFAVLHGEDYSHRLVTGTPVGEYANITELLSSDEINPRYEEFDSIKAISLSSDGLEGVALEGGEAHSGFWAGVVSQANDGSLNVSKLFRWLASLDRIVDDTSLLTIVRR